MTEDRHEREDPTHGRPVGPLAEGQVVFAEGGLTAPKTQPVRRTSALTRSPQPKPPRRSAVSRRAAAGLQRARH